MSSVDASRRHCYLPPVRACPTALLSLMFLSQLAVPVLWLLCDALRALVASSVALPFSTNNAQCAVASVVQGV